MGRINFLSCLLLLNIFSVSQSHLVESRQIRRATFQNPIMDDEWVVPHVYLHNDGYYYAARFGRYENDDDIHLHKSQSLTDWRNSEMIVIKGPVSHGTTQPEIQFIDRNFYIYYGMASSTESYQAYVIKAEDAGYLHGNWTAPQRLTYTNRSEYYAESASVFTYGNGQMYMIWSGSPQSGVLTIGLHIVRMCGPMTRCGDSILIAKPDTQGEAFYGPHVFQRFGRTFVLYKDSTSDSIFLMGIDDQKDPMIPSNWWRKDEAVFWNNEPEGISNVDIGSCVVSPDETESWLMYDVYDYVAKKYTPRAQRFTWNTTDRMPVFPRPVGLGTILETPSGQL